MNTSATSIAQKFPQAALPGTAAAIGSLFADDAGNANGSFADQLAQLGLLPEAALKGKAGAEESDIGRGVPGKDLVAADNPSGTSSPPLSEDPQSDELASWISGWLPKTASTDPNRQAGKTIAAGNPLDPATAAAAAARRAAAATPRPSATSPQEPLVEPTPGEALSQAAGPSNDRPAAAAVDPRPASSPAAASPAVAAANPLSPFATITLEANPAAASAAAKKPRAEPLPLPPPTAGKTSTASQDEVASSQAKPLALEKVLESATVAIEAGGAAEGLSANGRAEAAAPRKRSENPPEPSEAATQFAFAANSLVPQQPEPAAVVRAPAQRAADSAAIAESVDRQPKPGESLAQQFDPRVDPRATALGLGTEPTQPAVEQESVQAPARAARGRGPDEGAAEFNPAAAQQPAALAAAAASAFEAKPRPGASTGSAESAQTSSVSRPLPASVDTVNKASESASPGPNARSAAGSGQRASAAAAEQARAASTADKLASVAADKANQGQSSAANSFSSMLGQASSMNTPAPVQATAGASPTPANTNPVDIRFDTPVAAPEFRQAIGVQVSVLARDGVQHAELHLNPAEMGPISVRITLDGNQAQVDFGVDSAATRAMLESGLPELASALREAGLTLSGGGVSDHARGPGGDPMQQGAGDNTPQHRRDGNGQSASRAGLGADAETTPLSPPPQRMRVDSGLDLYA